MNLAGHHNNIRDKYIELIDEIQANIVMGEKNKINKDIIKSSLDLINSVSEMLTFYRIKDK